MEFLPLCFTALLFTWRSRQYCDDMEVVCWFIMTSSQNQKAACFRLLVTAAGQDQRGAPKVTAPHPPSLVQQVPASDLDLECGMLEMSAYERHVDAL